MWFVIGMEVLKLQQSTQDETTVASASLSTVALSDSLNLILLPDGGGVATNTLGSVDDLVGEALSNSLVGSEGLISGVLADEVDSLVDSSERRDVDSLSSHGTTGTDSSGVLTSTALGDGLEEDLKRVLISQQVDDLEGLLEVPHSHLLLAVLSALSNHDLVHKSLEDGAGDLLEALLLVLASGVRVVDFCLVFSDSEIVVEGLFVTLHVIVLPLAEELWSDSESLFCLYDEFLFVSHCIMCKGYSVRINNN